MNTKSKKIKAEFQDLLRFNSPLDKIEHRSKMIMFEFLDLIESEMANIDMNKKELAKKLDTSASYVTQLFTGSKTINLLTIAKLEEIFNVRFQITLKKPSIKKKNLKEIKNSVRSKRKMTSLD